MTAGTYPVEFASSARRRINRMPEKAAAAAIKFCFGVLAANPRRVGKPLTRDLADYRVARRGDYRVIYRIDDPAHLVYVVRIEHRSDVYRSRWHVHQQGIGDPSRTHREPAHQVLEVDRFGHSA